MAVKLIPGHGDTASSRITNMHARRAKRAYASITGIRTVNGMPNYAYGSTANFLSLGPMALICISKERRSYAYPRGVGISKIEREIR